MHLGRELRSTTYFVKSNNISLVYALLIMLGINIISFYRGISYGSIQLILRFDCSFVMIKAFCVK